MKFSTTALTLLLSSLVAAEGLNFFSTGSQKTLGDGEAVPGVNPLKYCNKDHKSEVFDLEYVDLNPNPPVAGTNLTIEAAGTVLEDVEEGAYVILQVKYGLIRLINTQADFCEQIKTVDLDCPLKKGHQKIIKDVAIPKEVPPGTYTVFADVYTKDKKKIICLEAVVKFGGA